MPMPNTIRFEGKSEHLNRISAEEKQVFPIGQTIFSILDTEWEPLIAEANRTATKIMNLRGSVEIGKRMENPEGAPYYLAARFNERLSTAFASMPVLEYLFSSQIVQSFQNKYHHDKAANIFASFLKEYPQYVNSVETFKNEQDEVVSFMSVKFLFAVENLLKKVQQFKGDIALMLPLSLDIEGPNHGLSVEERYQAIPSDMRKKYENSDSEVSVRTSFEPERLSIGYYSENICALAYLEFEYMCVNDISVRKCARCGRYFLPFSSNSLYCERIADDKKKKSCKDIAAMEKYSDKINDIAALKLFRKYANSYQMRCSRDPSAYPRAEYEAWKTQGKALLEQLKNGEITAEKFEKTIQLPEKR